MSQIESAILSHTVTQLDIELSEAGKEIGQKEGKILLHSKNCENIILNKEKGWRLCEIVQIKPKRDGSWMLRPAWLILSPPAMARWNLRSESEINVSSENLWVKIIV